MPLSPWLNNRRTAETKAVFEEHNVGPFRNKIKSRIKQTQKLQKERRKTKFVARSEGTGRGEIFASDRGVCLQQSQKVKFSLPGKLGNFAHVKMVNND